MFYYAARSKTHAFRLGFLLTSVFMSATECSLTYNKLVLTKSMNYKIQRI